MVHEHSSTKSRTIVQQTALLAFLPSLAFCFPLARYASLLANMSVFLVVLNEQAAKCASAGGTPEWKTTRNKNKKKTTTRMDCHVRMCG